MIGEAVDTAITLGWAHAAPHVPLAAYLAMVVSVAALACGHQGEPFPPLRWWRAVRRPAAELPFPALIASRRRPQPSWALPSPIDAESASPSPESESMEKR